jgi:putative ubiquitin-RnfH superfamily antitoxin RatB of RatAB toxin-antitoxin module
MSEENTIAVEVAFALPQKQKIVSLQVAPGTTALEAVAQSNIVEDFPEIDPATMPMGIFGQTLGTKGLAPAAQYVMQPGDRVEIYRPLQADPKAVRKQRAEKAKRERAR